MARFKRRQDKKEQLSVKQSRSDGVAAGKTVTRPIHVWAINERAMPMHKNLHPLVQQHAARNSNDQCHQRWPPFFHTKYSATKNKTTPIHSPEPNSVNARSTLTNVRVRCAWNHPATSWSGPVRGFAMARTTLFWKRMREFVTKKRASEPSAD